MVTSTLKVVQIRAVTVVELDFQLNHDDVTNLMMGTACTRNMWRSCNKKKDINVAACCKFVYVHIQNTMHGTKNIKNYRRKSCFI
jgi:hypothetical protein